MNIQTKSSILVLAIFLFGAICGFFLHSFISANMPPAPRGPKGPNSFAHRMESILQLNDAQHKAVDPILQKYDYKFIHTLENARYQGIQVMDSLKTEISPLLNERQNEILDDEINHFKNPPVPQPPDNNIRMPEPPGGK